MKLALEICLAILFWAGVISGLAMIVIYHLL